MINLKNRKYPIVYHKKHPVENERYVDISIATAAGILLLTFINGAVLGYALRKM